VEELIARLEAASGPSRDLDMSIYLATDPRMNGCYFLDTYIPERDGKPAPAYTSSIDAALMLVPLNYGELDFDLTRYCGGWSCLVSSGEQAWCTTGHAKDASTPALAICIAALRAKEKTDG